MATATQNQPLMHSSLYVGDLHPLATDGILHTKFAEIGTVVGVRICRDLASRASLGYGYVNFEEPRHAERALEVLNYEPLMGRPIRLMWSQRDPSLRKSGKGNIFIKNLDKSIEQKELYDTFGYFGRILSCKIAMDEHGNSKGYGFVHFDKEECAERAIEKINNMIIRDRVVFVGKFIPKAERKSQSRKMRFNNLYVKNFPPETDDKILLEMFSEFGEIKSACVMKDADGKSKGFGFVCFLEPERAESAVKAMHNREIGGRPLFTCRAQKKEERQEELRQRLEKQRAEKQSRYISNVNLYVKNLDDNIDDKRLKESFNIFGEITSAKVMMDANGRSKGFGFVCFTHPEQAAKAVTDMNGTIVGSKPLYVALAQRKEDRRAKLWAEHQQRLAQFRSTVAPMIPAVNGHAAAHSFFPPALQQAQRFYHSANPVLGSQPRWSRGTAMTANIPTHLGSVPNRPPMAGHYLNAPNPAAGMVPNQMAAFAQMRPPSAVGRQMVPGGMPSMQAGHHLPASAVLNQQRQQVSGRQSIAMPQVMVAPAGGMNQRPSMASVVANPPLANPNVRQQVGQQVPRAVMHPGMSNMAGAGGNVRFNQTARNVSTQPVPMPQNMSTVLSPLGDQSPLTISALAHMSEEEQKRMLGERLFPLIKQMYPDLARKLTGMLLGVDIAEVIHLLDSEESLRAKCEEAINVLKNNCNIVDETHTSRALNNIPGQNGDGSASSDIKSEMMNQVVATDAMKPEDK